ncbi:MAG: glycoside hydrolase family 57 protein [Candidatus Symbiothrix sp.]|jgi:alpha-amylase|nr:glycoside hydrolase family 57 protein [Candidatus Symbiothrix sp.]
MKTICLAFQVHQPIRLKRYRFFDIGSDHYYYDDFANEDLIRGVAERTYLPANAMLLDLIKEFKGKFKVAFSISGLALEQMEIYVPEVIEQFKELAQTGCVEFLGDTYDHSLASLNDPEEFESQVKAHAEKIELLFGQKPKIFSNTELIYSDDIAPQVLALGYKAMLMEGAKHVLGWRSPNYLYNSASAPKLRLLTRNRKFCDDISYRFSSYDWNEYPLVADKFVRWIVDTPKEEQVINLFLNYDVLGSLQPAATGIFDFFKAVPRFALAQGISFSTPSEVASRLKPVQELIVPYPCSWASSDKDISAWLGNVLQNEAAEKLLEIAETVRLVTNRRILQDWNNLQAADHFHYMSTKTFPGPSVFSPYDNAYDAFNNYMNVLSDFIDRVHGEFPEGLENEELNSLLTLIQNQEKTIQKLEGKIAKNKVLKPLAPKKTTSPKQTGKSKAKQAAG